MTYNQLKVIKFFVGHPKEIHPTELIAKKTLITSKSLGGVLSALSRTDHAGEALIIPLGRDRASRTLRWKLNTRLVNPVLAESEIKRLLSTYRE
jgi:hypothetical protein